MILEDFNKRVAVGKSSSTLKGSASSKLLASDPSKLIEFARKDPNRIGSNLLRESCKAQMNSLNVESLKMADQRCVDTDYERPQPKKQLKSPSIQVKLNQKTSPKSEP